MHDVSNYNIYIWEKVTLHIKYLSENASAMRFKLWIREMNVFVYFLTGLDKSITQF